MNKFNEGFGKISGNYNGSTGGLTFGNVTIYTGTPPAENFALPGYSEHLTIFDTSDSSKAELRIKSTSIDIDPSKFDMYVVEYSGGGYKLTNLDIGVITEIDNDGYTVYSAECPSGSYSIMLWGKNMKPFAKVINK